MLYLKSCPKCRGDILSDSDHVGAFLKCLQCSYTVNETTYKPSDQIRKEDELEQFMIDMRIFNNNREQVTTNE